MKSSTLRHQVLAKQRCSFKLEQPLLAESTGIESINIKNKESNLEAGLMSNINACEQDTRASLIAPSLAVSHRSIASTIVSPLSPASTRIKKKMSKSMSLTSNISSASTTYYNQSCFTKILIKCNYFVFGPDDNPMFVWLIILNVCVLYNTWLIIARQSFEKLQTEYQHYWRVADSIADTVYFIDVVVQFRTGYLEQGILSDLKKKLVRSLGY